MGITISVLIPAYNAQDFIIQALDSIAAQSRRPEQIIVVDDGSTDGTARLVELWSIQRDIAVDLLRQENKGPPVARNAGLAIARCTWVASLDADDLWLPYHLAELEQALISRPDLVAAFGDGVNFEREGVDSPPFSREKAVAAANKNDGHGIYILEKNLYTSLLPGSYIIPSSLIFHRETALEMGFFDDVIRYNGDRDFLLRLSRKGKFAFIDRVISRNRIHPGNITHPKNALRNLYFKLQILKKMLGQFTQLGLTEGEIMLTRVEMGLTVQRLMYAASVEGLKAYRQALLHLIFKMPFYLAAFNPKHLLRALYYSIQAYKKGAGRFLAKQENIEHGK